MQHILISRTDAIGDVVLTLPVCGMIKKYYPNSKISFLGNSYTKEIVSASNYVDNFIDYDTWKGDDSEIANQLSKKHIDVIVHIFPNKRIASIALKAGINTRVGTTNRIYHWIYCNKLIKLSRKNSELHESQLNLILLKGLGIDSTPSLKDIPVYYGLTGIPPLDSEFTNLLSKNKFNLIIHPKSSGSAKEWSLKRYSELINLLDENKYKIFISGSEKEKQCLGNWASEFGSKVVDITGMFSLSQFLSFINEADGLIAASTGPVHLAAAAGINALGLYSNSASINAKRWSPLGAKANYIQAEGGDINRISANAVFSALATWNK